MTDSATKQKLLLIGASSYVGSFLYKKWGRNGSIPTYCRTPVEGGTRFNLLDQCLSDILDDEKVSHALILSAVSKPDDCFHHQAESWRLNVERMKVLIDDLLFRDIVPVFFSTESVFDGKKGKYVETDRPLPIMAYGRQKLEIEDYLRSQDRDSLIVRLGRVFGSQRGDGTLFTGWLEQLEADQDIRCADNHVFSPIHVQDLGECLDGLIRQGQRGIYHLAGADSMSRYEMLGYLVDEYQKHRIYKGRISRCSMKDFSTPEPRPLDISMNPQKVMDDTGYRIQPLKQWVKDMVEQWCDHE